jgi:hypothetical protein
MAREVVSKVARWQSVNLRLAGHCVSFTHPGAVVTVSRHIDSLWDANSGFSIPGIKGAVPVRRMSGRHEDNCIRSSNQREESYHRMD